MIGPGWLWRTQPGRRPPIVVLCGSTRFGAAFDQAMLAETLAGKIVLTLGAHRPDAEVFAETNPQERENVLALLGQLHLAKIDLADEILVCNTNGYIGPHTRAEIEYAQARGKMIRFMEEPTPAR